jgi:hypothetical protein
MKLFTSMNRQDILKSKEFRTLCKELLVEEGYDACNIKSYVETYGLKFKKRASVKEIKYRIDFFIERKLNKIK